MSKTALLAATQDLHLRKIETLLRDDPTLLAVVDRAGRNIFQLACCVRPEKRGVTRAAQAKLVDRLLARGFEIDAKVGKDACTALFFSVARARNPTLLKLLLKRGARVTEAPGHGLYAAAWYDDTTSLRILLAAGAELEIVVGITPFLAAWTWRAYQAAKYLATRGADVNVQDRKRKTALHYGVEREFDPALLKWLVAHGASPDIEDRDGVTARDRAARKRDKRWLAALG